MGHRIKKILTPIERKNKKGKKMRIVILVKPQILRKAQNSKFFSATFVFVGTYYLSNFYLTESEAFFMNDCGCFYCKDCDEDSKIHTSRNPKENMCIACGNHKKHSFDIRDKQ